MWTQATHYWHRPMASTFLTKAQRNQLIEEYLECEEEMGEDQCADETRARLERLNNTQLLQECRDFMPDCI